MSRTTILVVDDEADVLKALGMLLKSHGYEVQTALDGRQALEMVEKIRPSLIILDIGLPFMDGFQVCQRLKENPKYKTIPIIILTGKTQTSYRVVSIACGADDYMIKPYEPDAILERIEALLKRKAA